MFTTTDQCVSELCDLAKSGEAEWLAHVDRIVEGYLAGSGEERAAKRIELAEKFRQLAPDRERSGRIFERILRTE